jgi:hypothetical protein
MLIRFRTAKGAAMGAALMYFCDPQQGRRRRAKARDQLAARWRRAGRDLERQRRYQAGVAEGRRHQSGAAHPAVDDRTLADRIRSELGTRFPHERVSLDVVDGVAELRGEMPDRDAMEDLIWRVCCVSGVAAVCDLMHLPGQPAPTKAEARRASAHAELDATRPTPWEPLSS